MPTARFIQIADLHLGAPFGWLPAPLRRARRLEQQRALDRAVSAAIERAADAILVAGDLFDREASDLETLAFALHAFAKPDCPPVFIAPGNHDPWSPVSPCWSARLLEARNFAWPAHVHVFSSGDWSDQPVPEKPIRVWGRCYTTGISTFHRPLDAGALSRIPRDPRELSVGVFHGAREGFRPASQKIAAPFSDDEARRAPFDYLAVGHYHVPQRLDEAGSARLAYSGSLVAIDATETGTHGALEVRATFGDGPARVEIEPLPLDPRVVHDLTVEVTGASSVDQVEERIAAALEFAGVRRDDLVTVRLRGRMMHGVRFTTPSDALEGQTFWMRVDRAQARPDYDLAAYRERPADTTEARFVLALLERLEHATDEAERARVESALYYGLDAFHLREVTPAYEDLGA